MASTPLSPDKQKLAAQEAYYEKLKKLATYVKRRRLEFHAISAVTGQGIDELKWALAKRVLPVAVGGAA